MSLLKSAATVGGLTLISRLLGFLRDQLIAFTLGTGPVAEAFFVAQRFPNLFRALFAEGAFNSAFVPQFARRIEGEGQSAAHKFATEIFSALLAWLLVFTALSMIAMPWLIYLIAPGFSQDVQKLQLTIDLTQICFPYLLFMSLTALQSGVLNSLNRFTAAAAAPILLNIVMILSNVLAWALGTGNSAATGYIFAWGVSLAGVAQFLLLAIACRRAGMPLFPTWPTFSPDVKKVLVLSVPGIISGGIMQINLLIATIIATSLDRAVAYLYYADRLYQLPLGVIGVAIGVVLLPDLSRKLRAGDNQAALNSQNRALELSLFLTVPAAIALMAIPVPILHTVFEHGEFTAADTLAVAPTVLAFAAGLPAFAMTKVFQPGFYAREDTKTPMRFAIISVVDQHCGQPFAVAVVRPCGNCDGNISRGLGQCHIARHFLVAARALPDGWPVEGEAAPYSCFRPVDGTVAATRPLVSGGKFCGNRKLHQLCMGTGCFGGWRPCQLLCPGAFFRGHDPCRDA